MRLRRLKIRADQQVRLIDRKFIEHLAEMHPVSALHEFCQRMDWPAPNMFLAFECGPPMYRMYIFKVMLQLKLLILRSHLSLQAIVNGMTFQPTIAVDEKKDAKANAAWMVLQELGFLKPDPANPL